jgi:hypothetical protein
MFRSMVVDGKTVNRSDFASDECFAFAVVDAQGDSSELVRYADTLETISESDTDALLDYTLSAD